MSWIVVRVRGGIHARRDIVQTLEQLHLRRPNHATVVPEEPSYAGMLFAVQGYVTWGDADAPTVEMLLQNRGETVAGERLSAAGGTPRSGLSVPALANEVTTSGLARVGALKPRIRLKPPKGGWRSTKKPFAVGGALGYRGPKIAELVRRMV